MGLTKAQLEALNLSSFPDNTSELITPEILRTYNSASIENTVNQDTYTTDSASFNNRILSITGSGTIDTGSFATTGSNSFVGNQTINGSLIVSSSTSSSIKVPTGFQVDGFVVDGNLTLRADTFSQGAIRAVSIYTPVLGSGTGNPIKFTSNTIIDSEIPGQPANLLVSGAVNVSSSFTASLEEGYVWVGDSNGRTITVATSSFGGGGTLPSGLLSSSVTNFVDYSASVDTRINGIVVGSGFATTGSNSFIGQQEITNGNVRFNTTGSLSTNGIQFNNSEIFQNNFLNFVARGNVGVDFSTDGTATDSGVNINFRNQNTNGDIQFTTNDGNIRLTSGGSKQVSLSGSQVLLNNVDFIPFSSSVNSRILAGGGSGDTIITTGSIRLAADNGVAIGPTNGLGGTQDAGAIRILAHSGSLILSNNAFTNTTASLLHLSASDNTLLTNFIFKPNSSNNSTIISGSGNIFTNPTFASAGYTSYVGGSDNLFASVLPQITGSAASVSGNRPTMNRNITSGHSWFINQASNPALHQYNHNISMGSANQWNFNMLGNTGSVTVQNNLGLNANLTINSPSRSIAEINSGVSGSAPFQLNNNIIQGQIIYQGPVNAIQHLIQNNNIAGTLNLNAQSSSRQINMNSNTINGVLILNDNTVNAPTLGGLNSFSLNNINGTTTLNNRASSSFALSNNNINTWTISNDFDASSITVPGSRVVAINGNVLFGVGSNNIQISGSNGAVSFVRGFSNNMFGGSFISASAIANGGDSNMIATIGVGHGLNVVGTARRDASNPTGDGATQGSAFFGRWNKEGAGFNTTGDVILAIGTGTSGSAGITRKTGFLIDSGSNTFVEGTLNVSGSTTMTGSLSIASTFQLQLPTGSNQQVGTATLVAGEAIISNSLVTANSIIMLTKQTFTSNHFVGVSAKSAGSFTISSSNSSDTDEVGWMIINNS
jgi:hypothetical protein